MIGKIQVNKDVKLKIVRYGIVIGSDGLISLTEQDMSSGKVRILPVVVKGNHLYIGEENE